MNFSERFICRAGGKLGHEDREEGKAGTSQKKASLLGLTFVF
jgi:hypothetical protein